jgi:hypothetical protein
MRLENSSEKPFFADPREASSSNIDILTLHYSSNVHIPASRKLKV